MRMGYMLLIYVNIYIYIYIYSCKSTDSVLEDIVRLSIARYHSWLVCYDRITGKIQRDLVSQPFNQEED